MQAPIFSTIDTIYPGPHIDDDGVFDNRVWFQIPIDLDLENNYITYLVFPYGGKNTEIKEIKVTATDTWME